MPPQGFRIKARSHSTDVSSREKFDEHQDETNIMDVPPLSAGLVIQTLPALQHGEHAPLHVNDVTNNNNDTETDLLTRVPTDSSADEREFYASLCSAPL